MASRASQSHGRACSTGTSCYRDRDSTWKSTLSYRASYNRQSILFARLFCRSFQLFCHRSRRELPIRERVLHRVYVDVQIGGNDPTRVYRVVTFDTFVVSSHVVVTRVQVNHVCVCTYTEGSEPSGRLVSGRCFSG